jgi:putative flippase GtrA
VSKLNTLWSSQKIRYLVIGGYNTVFGYGCFALLWWLFSQQLHYIVLLTISHILSVINAYMGYRLFVFQSKGKWLKEFFKFNLVYLGTFAINLVALPVLIEEFKVHALIAQALIIVITVLASYVIHNKITFKKQPDTKQKSRVSKRRNQTKKRNKRRKK